MPAVRTHQTFSENERFSREDVGLREDFGAKVLRESLDHLPLFQAGRRGMPPSGGAAAADPLSKGHNSSTSEVLEENAPDPGLCLIWKGGSLVQCPAIPTNDPRVRAPALKIKQPKRGKVTHLTSGARRRLKELLSKITWAARAYTMALTLPGDFRNLSPVFIKACFVVLCNRMTASREPAVRQLGMVWKMELQQRGAIHFHLLLYGVTEENRRSVQRWIAEEWNRLVCVDSSLDEREKHLWWHLRDGFSGAGRGKRSSVYDSDSDNMQEVKNFAGYFAKYLGKEECAVPSGEGTPGKWWGKVGTSRIPWAEKREISLPVRMRVLVQRRARKMRQKRANGAKCSGVLRAIEKSGLLLGLRLAGLPAPTEFSLSCGIYRAGTIWGEVLRQAAEQAGVKFGKYVFPVCLRYSSVKLTGAHMPGEFKRLLEWAAGVYQDELASAPF